MILCAIAVSLFTFPRQRQLTQFFFFSSTTENQTPRRQDRASTVQLHLDQLPREINRPQHAIAVHQRADRFLKGRPPPLTAHPPLSIDPPREPCPSHLAPSSRHRAPKAASPHRRPLQVRPRRAAEAPGRRHQHHRNRPGGGGCICPPGRGCAPWPAAAVRVFRDDAH